MIGIIEKVLSDTLVRAGGDSLRAEVFVAAGLPPDHVFRLDRHYPDELTGRLIAAALDRTGLSERALFDAFSICFLEFVQTVFPEFLRMCATSEDLVRKQAKIHALIASGSRPGDYSRESTDKFQIVESGEHRLTVRYRSQLQLWGLYESLVTMVADLYGDQVRVERQDCGLSSGDACLLTVTWTAIGGTPTKWAAPAPAGVCHA